MSNNLDEKKNSNQSNEIKVATSNEFINIDIEKNFNYINKIFLKLFNFILPKNENINLSIKNTEDILEYLNKNDRNCNISKSIEDIKKSITIINEKITSFQNKIDKLERNSTNIENIYDSASKNNNTKYNNKNLDNIIIEFKYFKEKTLTEIKKNIKSNEIEIINLNHKFEDKVNDLSNLVDNKLLQNDKNIKILLDKIEKELKESKEIIQISQKNIKEYITDEIDKTLQNYESKVLQDFLNINTDGDKKKQNDENNNSSNVPIMNIYYQKLFFQENFKSLLDSSFNKCLSKIHSSINKLRKEIRSLQLYNKKKNILGATYSSSKLLLYSPKKNKRNTFTNTHDSFDLFNSTHKSNFSQKNTIDYTKKEKLIKKKSTKKIHSNSFNSENKINKLSKRYLFKHKDKKNEVIIKHEKKPIINMKENKVEIVFKKNNSIDKSPKKFHLKKINKSFLPIFTQYKSNSKIKKSKNNFNYKPMLIPINEI